jgi:uncharacterized lipoprotein NlpE involved in copper resistance
MNKYLCLCVFFFLFLGFNSCKSVNNNTKSDFDWAGSYSGVFPGANSDIKHNVTLNKDRTYEVSIQYVDKSDDVLVFTGTFSWKDSNIIELDNKNIPRFYMAEKNTLTLLDIEGNKITGNSASMYVLKKK